MKTMYEEGKAERDLKREREKAKHAKDKGPPKKKAKTK
jgi:hypothetical protein